MAKRDIGYVEQYDALCHGLLNLSTAPAEEAVAVVGEVDLLCESLISACALNADDTLDKFLSRPWYAHLGGASLRRATHAVRRMRAIDCATWRDVLWYNDSLDRPASLQRLPPCLVDWAHSVAWKQPPIPMTAPASAPATVARHGDHKRDRSRISRIDNGIDLNTWRTAWDSFYRIYDDTIVAELSTTAKRHLHHRRSRPPPGVNYFYFAWLDRQYDVRMPVLVHVSEGVTPPDDSPQVTAQVRSEALAADGGQKTPTPARRRDALTPHSPDSPLSKAMAMAADASPTRQSRKLVGKIDSKVFGTVDMAAKRVVRPRLLFGSKSSVL